MSASYPSSKSEPNAPEVAVFFASVAHAGGQLVDRPIEDKSAMREHADTFW